MKKFFGFVLGAVLFLSVQESQAQVQGDWLGGAIGPVQCQRIAARAGYTGYYFGPVWNGGIYYSNGCLGLPSRVGGGNNGGKVWFSVYVNNGTDLRDCRRDIHDDIRDASCEVDERSRNPRLLCEANASSKSDLRRVRCVDVVEGPFNGRP